MKSQKRTISPALYFIIISSWTNLIFLVVGVVLLSLVSIKLLSSTFLIIIFFLIWKGAIVGLAVRFSFNKAHNKEFLVKFTGSYLGRFFGLIIGAFWGGEIFKMLNQENTIGFIIGALAFYFTGRWIGPKVSVTIAGKVDKVFSLSETTQQEKTVEPKK